MTDLISPSPQGTSSKIRSLRDVERANADRLLGWITGLLPPDVRPEFTDDALANLKACIRAAYTHYKLFDADYYRESYLYDLPEDQVSVDPFEHYLKEGRYKGYSPNPYFDAYQYIRYNADISSICLDACLHYMFYGWKEHRPSGTIFDAHGYLDGNPDVKAAGSVPFQHFMLHGRFSDRTPNGKSALFNELDALARKGAASGTLNYGTLIFVSHDANVGGAQEVVRSIGKWVRYHTAYDVRFVTVKPGGMQHKFNEIAPTFVLDDEDEEEMPVDALEKFCGPNVRGVFLNSIASAGFLKHFPQDVPVLSYIHELPHVLRKHEDDMALIKDRATTVIGGSEAVRSALRDTFGFPTDRLEMVQGFLDRPIGLSNLSNRSAAKTEIDEDGDTLIITACGVLHWRKSPEIFIDVAQRVLAHTDKKLRFIWVGGGPDEETCQNLIAKKGLADHVTLTGFAPDVQKYLNASDIFLLPSQEDPFPLVCLMAGMAQNPIICFADAGGMPELVEEGCGTVVPFLDAAAMAEATLRYIDNPDLRAEHGALARKLVQSRHTIDQTGPQLFSLIQQAAALKPSVSVVVPNYNYEAYLPQRLASIAAQTFQDFEVILIDDQSNDGSVAVLEDWAKTRLATRVIINDTNSGSPFKQWIKGMELAQADLIWIAEADDFCDPNLLATLVPAFEDRNTFLAYAKSVPVNAEGQVQGDYEGPYLNRIANGRWSEPYDVTDNQEADLGLGIANCIPNGSAVMMRKFDPEPEFVARVTSMRMCGDWYFYLRAMRGGKVSYRNAATNYHRRHDTTVTAQTEGSPRYFEELQTVRDYVQDTYNLAPTTIARIEQFVTEDVDRFGITDPKIRAEILSAATRVTPGKRLPSVLFVVSDLAPGGGQMFAVRMANAWAAMGGRAVLGNVAYLPSHDKVVAQISPRVAFIDKFDAAQNSLQSVCAAYDIDLIHSSLWWADAFVATHGIEEMADMPWVTTMHGCHESVLEERQIDERFPELMDYMRERMDTWVPIADKNMRVFDAYGMPTHVKRVPNGAPVTRNRSITRAELGLRENAVVLCLASRAIESKGWLAAAEIVQSLNASGAAVDLMLIGEGDAHDVLQDRALPHVHLYGHQADIHDYMAVCDIGVLPSFFVGESMPLVLLELMGLSKPIVATDAGEIPYILGAGDTPCGVIVPLINGQGLDVPAFEKALRDLITTPDKRIQMGKAAKCRYDAHFTIEKMMDQYREIYDTTIARRAALSAAR
ncbi:MAG: glycosyltransferase [Pseudomonadota bacterium]